MNTSPAQLVTDWKRAYIKAMNAYLRGEVGWAAVAAARETLDECERAAIEAVRR